MKTKADHLLQLASQELTREKRRLFGMFFTMLLAGLLLFCGLLAFSALLVVLSWETEYRLHSLTALMLAYFAGAVIAWLHFRKLDNQGEKALEDAQQELTNTLQRYDVSLDAHSNTYPQSITMQLLTQQPGLTVFLVTELLSSLLGKFNNRKAAKRRRKQARDARRAMP